MVNYSHNLFCLTSISSRRKPPNFQKRNGCLLMHAVCVSSACFPLRALGGASAGNGGRHAFLLPCASDGNHTQLSFDNQPIVIYTLRTLLVISQQVQRPSLGKQTTGPCRGRGLWDVELCKRSASRTRSARPAAGGREIAKSSSGTRSPSRSSATISATAPPSRPPTNPPPVPAHIGSSGKSCREFS